MCDIEKNLILEHESSREKRASDPFEGVSEAIRGLGRKFLKYESIFNPPTLVPIVEKYNLETIQRDGWVPEAFLDAGTNLFPGKLICRSIPPSAFRNIR